MFRALKAGFEPLITPTLVRPDIMAGTGFLGAHADEIYYLERDDLYLTGTSEVALAGYHTDEILDLSNGPLRYAGWSACYRREAGSAGRDTRGIIRVHQFHKVEMFAYVTAADAAAEHARIGETALRLGVAVLIGCGPQMRDAAESARRVAATTKHQARIEHVADPQASVPELMRLLSQRDAVLIKGSRSMAMERVVEALCLDKGESA